MKLKRFSQFINESYYGGRLPSDEEIEQRNELFRKRNDQYAKDNVDTPTFRTKEQNASAESVRSQIAGLDRRDTLKLISICAGYVDPSKIEYVIDTIYSNEELRRVRPSNGESSESLFSMIEDPKVARLALVPALSHAHNLGIDRSEIMEVIGSDPVDETFGYPKAYGRGSFPSDDEEARRRQVDKEEVSRRAEQSSYSQKVDSAIGQIAGLDRRDTLKLISICASHVDSSQIEYVIDTVYSTEDFRRVKPSNGEPGESLFSMVEDPRIAKLCLVPALSHAHNLGIDRSEIMEVIGSDPVDEMLEDEEDEYGSGQFSEDDFESDSWEEGHSAAERMINGSGGSTRNPHAEDSRDYAEFEAGFKAGLKAYGGMLPKQEFRRIA